MLLGKRVVKQPRLGGPLPLPTASGIHDPLPLTLIVSWKLSPRLTDESLRPESHFNNLSPYSRQATPPCLPANLCVSASEQNFPLPRQHPWGGLSYFASLARAGSLTPPPKTEMGFIPLKGTTGPTGKDWTPSFRHPINARQHHRGTRDQARPWDGRRKRLWSLPLESSRPAWGG